jgi:adenosylcobinamide-phosphate synthase
MSLFAAVLIALVLDLCFKEPKRFHPLVGFGNLASYIEQHLNRTRNSRVLGAVAWCLAVLPLVALACGLAFVIEGHAVLAVLVSSVVLYLAIGWQSLLSHALAVAKPLAAGDLEAARVSVGMIVSRDTRALDDQAVASAATESVLENGADAIFAALFWFCVLGIPGVVLYRLSNTLDAMWGYKNDRYLHFGWCAARMDDLLNLIPARLTALSYALLGQTKLALKAWQDQAKTWKSPNAGPVMASGAGAINVALGGAAVYHGTLQQRPPLGPSLGDKPSADSIFNACRLVNKVVLLWLLVLGFGALFELTQAGKVFL